MTRARRCSSGGASGERCVGPHAARVQAAAPSPTAGSAERRGRQPAIRVWACRSPVSRRQVRRQLSTRGMLTRPAGLAPTSGQLRAVGMASARRRNTQSLPRRLAHASVTWSVTVRCASQAVAAERYSFPLGSPVVPAEVPAAGGLAARTAADRVAADLLPAAPAAEVAGGVRGDAGRVAHDAQRPLVAQRRTRHQVGLRHPLGQAGAVSAPTAAGRPARRRASRCRPTADQSAASSSSAWPANQADRAAAKISRSPSPSSGPRVRGLEAVAPSAGARCRSAGARRRSAAARTGTARSAAVRSGALLVTRFVEAGRLVEPGRLVARGVVARLLAGLVASGLAAARRGAASAARPVRSSASHGGVTRLARGMRHLARVGARAGRRPRAGCSGQVPGSRAAALGGQRVGRLVRVAAGGAGGRRRAAGPAGMSGRRAADRRLGGRLVGPGCGWPRCGWAPEW